MKARGLELMLSLGGGCVAQVAVDPESVSEAKRLYNDLSGQELEVIVRKYHNKRSLAANAYCWKLINDLAGVLKITPAEVYREQIKNIGGNCEIVPIRNDAVETWERNWGERGIGWVTQRLESKLEGYTNIVCYYGSSTYDSLQMSRLITLIVEECKAHGIETKTPSELALLMADWRSA